MFKKLFPVTICLLIATINVAQNKTSNDLVQINYRALVSRADLQYDGPVAKSEDGMPVGNGRMGTLAWTIPSALQFQVNRVDVFGNNSASNNFYERNTDYCGGTGAVAIDFGEAVFTKNNFRQRLSCYDGAMSLQGNKVQADVFAWHNKDVLLVHLKDDRKRPLPVQVDLRMLRMPVAKRGDHAALSKIQVIGDHIVLTQEFREGDYYCASALVIASDGRPQPGVIVNDMTVRLTIAANNGAYPVYIASAASFDPKEDVIKKAFSQLDAARKMGYPALVNDNRQWWYRFWERSFVHCSSADKEADFIEANYAYYLYVMASSSRGDYPPKFNGMLWTTGGDARKWGGLYWGANQGCLYNGLFPANRPELLKPMFNMYTQAYASYEKAAEQQWGSKGIFIPEVTGFDNTPILPEDIAAEMRDLYLRKKEWKDRSQRFVDYSYTKLPFISRWNWKKDEGWKEGRWVTGDKGGGAFGHTNHIFSRGAKIAYQYWLQYEYSQDTQWLRQYAYPMLKGVAEFYRNFPNVRKEEDGKYHIRHVNDNESIWDGHNTVEEISSMMGIFPVLIKASEILSSDADMRERWKEFIANLSPLPLNSKGTAFAGSLLPVMQGNAERRPDGNTMPVWFFDLCTLESNNKERLTLAKNTYDAYFPRGIDTGTKVFVLSRLAVVGALQGKSEATRYLIPHQLRTAETPVLANRMDLREGYQTTSVQRLGRAAEALHYALCQSIPENPGRQPVIRVFPAWPADWDAAFTLLCRGGFLVSASMRQGTIGFVTVLSQSGGLCSIRNPWPGKSMDVYLNNKKEQGTNASLLEISTKPGDNLMLVPAGKQPSECSVKLLQ